MRYGSVRRHLSRQLRRPWGQRNAPMLVSHSSSPQPPSSSIHRRQISSFSSSNTTTTNKNEIPIIDIGPLFENTTSPDDDGDTDHGSNNTNRQRKESVGIQLVHAATNVGFFYVTNHTIPSNTLSEARTLATKFFDLPTDSKEQISIKHSPSLRGYQRVGINVTQGKRDWHEALDFYRDMPSPSPDDAMTDNKSPTNYGLNQWPNEKDIPGFHKFYTNYVDTMLNLGRCIMSGMALGLSLSPNYFDPYFVKSFWVMRLIHYPPPRHRDSLVDEDEGGWGCGEHTDYGCLTLVNQDPDVVALEAKTISGDWVQVPPVEGAMAVNVGDMLSRWTNGTFRATPHRVLLGDGERKKGRVSVPFFVEPNWDAWVEPLEVCCCDDYGGKKKFDGVRYGDHLLKKLETNFDFTDEKECR